MAKKKRVVYTIPQQHFDPVWRKPPEQYREWQFNFITKFLNICKKFPEFTFALGQADVMRHYFEENPERKPELLQLIKEDRFEMVCGMEVIPDTNIPGSESMVRTGLLGKRYAREEFGADPVTAWYYDTFGLNAQCPQILVKSGFKYLHAIRFGRTDVKVPCYWEGLDGTRVLLHSKDHAHNGWEYFAIDNVLHVFQNLKNRFKYVLQGEGKGWDIPKPRYFDEDNTLPILWYEPVSEEETPSWHVAKKIKDFNEEQDEFEFRFGLPREYFEALEREMGDSLPVSTGEMNPEFTGVYTTRSWLKKANRRAESSMLTAERLASLAIPLGYQFPEEAFLENWRKLVFSHHHDGICGCHIDLVDELLTGYYQDVTGMADSESEKAMAFVARNISTCAKEDGQETPVVVFNPVAWERTEITVVEVSSKDNPKPEEIVVVEPEGVPLPTEARASKDGRSVEVRFQASALPSLGHKTFFICRGKRPGTDLGAEGGVIENQFYRIEAANKGVLRIFDKELDRELIDPEVGFANELLCEHDTGDVYVGSYPGGSVPGYRAISRLKRAEKTGLCASMSASGVFPKLDWLDESYLAFSQRVSLYPNIKRVDFVTDFEWKGHQTRISVLFPTTAKTDEASYEIAYGTMMRRPYKPMPLAQDMDWPAQTWVGVDGEGYGIALLNRGTGGVRVSQGNMAMSLFRSPLKGGYLASPFSCEKARGHGRHTFEYALTSYEGTWKEGLAFRAGQGFNFPPLAMATDQHGGELPAKHAWCSVVPGNVVVSALKPSEDDPGAWIVRIYEAAGTPTEATIHLGKSFSEIREVNLIEDLVQEAPVQSGNQFKSELHGFEIRTFLLK